MWNRNEAEGTAVGAVMPVVIDGRLIASGTPLWDDERGVGLSIDCADIEDITAAEVHAFAASLHQLADMPGPD
jgi:hypothetical protein